MSSFDLIEYQQEARSLSTPKDLYELWDKVCQYYDRSEISSYELDEMKSTIWAALAWISGANADIEKAARQQSTDIIDMCPPQQERTKFF